MKKQVVGGLALSLIFGSGLFGTPQDAGTHQTGEDHRITIRIHNYAFVPSSVLRQAEQTAGSVLRDAKVDSAWVECPTVPSSSTEVACTHPVTPLILILNLLPESMTQRLNFQDDAFGVAVESSEKDFGFLSSVFYDRVRRCAVHERIDLAPLLGHVIAHELGHLLLGIHSHSRSGLMSASWSCRQILAVEQRGLFFSTSEAKRLQAAMMARSQGAMGVTEARNEHNLGLGLD